MRGSGDSRKRQRAAHKPSFEQLESRLLLSASIEGTVWNDVNGNGIQETGESGLINWAVNLDNGQQTVTDSDGQYRFDGLDAGSYTVSQVLPDGWVQTSPFDSSVMQYGGSTVFEAAADSTAEIQKVETDADGNLYYAGRFSGTVDLDPGAGTDLRTAQGSKDIFLVKFNADGTRAWTATWQGGETDRLGGVAIDGSGNVWVTGGFSGSQRDMDPTAGTDLRSSLGWSGAFLTKINADGSYGLTHVFGGAGASARGGAVAVDGDGNVYVTGSFTQTVDFDPTAGTDARTSPGQSGFDTSLFVTRIDADGSYNWTRIVGAGEPHVSNPVGSAWGKAIAVDSQGTVYVGGDYISHVDFDPGPDYDVILHQGDTDVFVTRLNTDGDYLGTWAVGGSEYDRLYDLTVDAQDNVFWTGTFSGSVDFNPLTAGDYQFRTDRIDGWFATRMNADGSYGWTRISDSADVSGGVGLAVNAAGQVQLAVHSPEASNPAGADAQLVSLRTDGQIQGILSWNVSDSTDFPELWDVAVTPEGSVILGGRFARTSDLDPGAGVDEHGVAPRATSGFAVRLTGSAVDHQITLSGNDVAANANFGAHATDPLAHHPKILQFGVEDLSTHVAGYTDQATVGVSLTAADLGGRIAAWMVTESATAPAAAAAGWQDWLTNPPGTYTLASSTEGTYTLYAWVRDNDGNVSAASSAAEATVVLDTTAPVVSVQNTVSGDPRPAVSGWVDDAAATVDVTVEGGTYRAANNGDGTWTLARGRIPTLANGIYTVSVTATDRLGRSSTAVGSLSIAIMEVSAKIDETATDSGFFFPGDTLTVTVDLSETGGTVTPPFEIQARLSTDTTWSGDDVILLPTYLQPGLPASQTSTVQFDVTLPPGAAPGTYFLLVKADVGDVIAEGDEANNIDATSVANIVVLEPDLTAPSLIDWGLHEDTGASGQDKVTSDAQPGVILVFSEPVTGSGSDLEIRGPQGTTVTPTSVLGWGTPQISISLPELTQDGVYTITLRGSIQDVAGNAFNGGANQVLNFTLDRESPTVTVDPLTTDDDTPALTGTVSEAVNTVEVTVNGQTYTAQPDGSGRWILPDGSIQDPLRHGFHDVRVTATDPAGNTGSDTTSDELVVLWEGYEETFPIDNLGDPTEYGEWTFQSSNDGRFYRSNGQLRMDDRSNDDVYSLNEAILTLDLSDLFNLRLSFSHVNTFDQAEPLPETFTGNVEGDGVSISVNGFHWVKLADLDQDFTNRTFALEDALLTAQNMAGSTDRSAVRIKFQQYGFGGGTTAEFAGGGRNIDDVRIDYLIEPEIRVQGRSQEITAGDNTPRLADGTSFGRVEPLGPRVQRTFTVTNTGYEPLAISDVFVPEGYVIVETLPSTILVQQSATLVVALDTTLPGTKSGQITIVSNDLDEHDFSFAVTGSVADLEAGVDPLITSDTSPRLTGTVNDPEAEVRVVVNSQTYQASNQQDGTWSVADDVVGPLAENQNYIVTVIAQNLGTGELSTPSNGLLVIDTIAPAVTVDVDPVWNEVVTSDTTPPLSGSVDDPAAQVIVVIDDREFSATNNGDGTWTLADNTISPHLVHGAHDVVVRALDEAGNEGTAETTVFVDLLPPTVSFWTVEGDEDGRPSDWFTWVRNPYVTFQFSEPVLLRAGADPLSIFQVEDAEGNAIAIREVVAVDLETGQESSWGGPLEATYAVRFRFFDDLVPVDTPRTEFTITLNPDAIVDRAGDVLADNLTVSRQFAIETVKPTVTLDTRIVGDSSPKLTGTIDDFQAAVTVIIDATLADFNDPTFQPDETQIFAINPDDTFAGVWTLPAGVIPDMSLGVHDVLALAVDPAGNLDVKAYQVEVAMVYEDFSGESPLDRWQIVNQGSIGHANWVVDNGVLRQTGDSQSVESAPGRWVSNGFYPIWQPGWSRLNHEGTFALFDGGDAWTDVKIAATLQSSNPNDIGIMFRVNPDTNSYYRFSMSEAGQFQRLMKVENGQFTLLAENRAGYTLNTDHQLEIVADGTLIRVTMDGQVLMEVSDYGNATPALASGTVALYARANTGAAFDNIYVANMGLANDATDNQAPRAQDQDVLARLDRPVTLHANAHDPDQGPGALTYAWTVDPQDGSFDTGLQISTDENPVFVPNSALTGDQIITVQLAVSDGVGTTHVEHTIYAQDLSATVLLSQPFGDVTDSFEDGRSNGWVVVDEGEREGPSRWEIRDAETVAQMSNIHSWPHSLGMPGTFITYDAGRLWTDYRVNLDMASHDDDGVGVMVRYQDPENYYRFEWNNQTGVRRLVKAEQGVFTVLAEDHVRYEVGRTYDVEIEALWSGLTVRVNGDEVFAVTDTAFAEGTIALYSWGNVNGVFRGLQVTNLEGLNQSPTISLATATPAVISDENDSTTLAVTANDPDGTIQSFTWALHPDNPAAGTLTGVSTQGNTSSVTFTPHDISGHAWVKINVTVADDQQDTVVHTFRILVTDNQAPVLADETFANNFDNWTVVDQGDLDRPSDWQLGQSGGRDYLAQTAPIHANNAELLGTFVKYDPGAAWQDVGITVDMNSTDDDAIGVMFRVVDDNNYYRLNWNNLTGTRRLEKIENGVLTVLAEQAVSYNLNTWYEVSIQAIGDSLSVFIDGESVFQVTDSSHATGTVALYTWNNDRAKFDNVQVRDLTP